MMSDRIEAAQKYIESQDFEAVKKDVEHDQGKDHLLNMDHLKEGNGLRRYEQKDPLMEYKHESFDMYEAMMQRFQEETVRYLYLMQVVGGGSEQAAAQPPQDGDGSGRGQLE